MEIYNECINDLLSPGKSNLKVKDDPNVNLPTNSTDLAWS